jgi:hypothetical protein
MKPDVSTYTMIFYVPFDGFNVCPFLTSLIGDFVTFFKYGVSCISVTRGVVPFRYLLNLGVLIVSYICVPLLPKTFMDYSVLSQNINQPPHLFPVLRFVTLRRQIE